VARLNNENELTITTRRPRKRPSSIAIPRSSTYILPFGWYGGKFSHLRWLLPLLPDAHTYVEPFAGSGSVLLNRRPSAVEVYNDIDGEVCNFFSVLRQHSEELIRQIGLTPFSREEYAKSLTTGPNIEPIERARRFYVRARQVRTGMAQTATLGRWANCIGNSRNGMAAAVSRWLGSVDSLPEIATRLLQVQIENRPAEEVIGIYDSPSTLFYCDPPYVHETRGDVNMYNNELFDEDHVQLAEMLTNVQGMVAISNYDNQLFEKLYPLEKWTKVELPAKTIHSTKDTRSEVLWINYELASNLFDSSLLLGEESLLNA
jgi:DNA adenine methylase